MPRGARLDAPGTLHHVMVRGIEKRKIVDNDDDRENFITRIGELSLDTGTPIFAWTLMDNHAHILLKSGAAGLPAFMRRLLGGYAASYNRRHNRHGHLFQNRYKSIICEEDPYFMELVRYIHLNPLRAGVVDTLTRALPATIMSCALAHYIFSDRKTWYNAKQTGMKTGRCHIENIYVKAKIISYFFALTQIFH